MFFSIFLTNVCGLIEHFKYFFKIQLLYVLEFVFNLLVIEIALGNIIILILLSKF